jgi:hypothetical protein
MDKKDLRRESSHIKKTTDFEMYSSSGSSQDKSRIEEEQELPEKMV